MTAFHPLLPQTTHCGHTCRGTTGPLHPLEPAGLRSAGSRVLKRMMRGKEGGRDVRIACCSAREALAIFARRDAKPACERLAHPFVTSKSGVERDLVDGLPGLFEQPFGVIEMGQLNPVSGRRAGGLL